jgi:hypothetical protein
MSYTQSFILQDNSFEKKQAQDYKWGIIIVVQTVKTDLTMVLLGPSMSLVPIICGLFIGGSTETPFKSLHTP